MSGASTNSPDLVKTTQGGIAYVTSFRTKFVELMDYVKQCTSDDQAKHAWSQIVGIEVGLLGVIVRNEKVRTELGVNEQTAKDAKKLLDDWAEGKITMIEKTRFKRHESDGGEATYTMLWDSTPAEASFRELDVVSRIVDREKQSQMVQRLIQFSGRCLEVIMGIGLLKLDDLVAVPFRHSDEYTSEKMNKDLQDQARLYG